MQGAQSLDSSLSCAPGEIPPGAPPPTKVWTIDDIKTANRMRGQHFFAPDTMRFFASRVLSTVYQGPGGIYFITSDQFRSTTLGDQPRRYTVRRFNPETGEVGTVGPFNVLTKYRAEQTARMASIDGKEAAEYFALAWVPLKKEGNQ